MSERLYQARFDHSFEMTHPRDVTPRRFAGLPPVISRPERRQLSFPPLIPETGRFIREARAEVTITCPTDAADYLRQNIYTPFSAFDQEEMWVLLLSTRNKITHEVMVYRGTVNQMAVRPAELFKEAVRVNATALIVTHCHPSGDPAPSPEDIHVTCNAVEAGQLLGIELLDHIIVGKDRWVSLKERGLGSAVD